MTQVIPTEQLSVSVGSSIASQMPAEVTCLSEQVWVAFSADVNTMTADALLGAIGQQLMQGKSDLHLMLSTPGGTVSAGLSIYNRLRALPIRITTYNVGQVASIGNVIFQSGSRRFASPTSSFMFHGVGMEVQHARLESKQLAELTRGLENDQALIGEVLARHTFLSEEEIGQLFRDAAFVRPDVAKQRGIVDDVIDIKVPAGVPFLQLVFQR